MSLDARAFKGLSRFLAPSAGGPLADRALTEKLISPEQLHECVTEQDRTGRPLDEIMVSRGFLKTEDVTRLRQAPLPPEVAEAAADPNRQLGHYVLVSLLGVGGMAEVWKSWDRSLGRWVAVKYLKPDVGHPTQRIEREGRMAGGLSHPNIVSIFERGHHAGRSYLVMPYVEGAHPAGPLDPREAARIALAVAEALAHAHERGVIHRDIKPHNVILDAVGRVFLTDFGLAIPGESATSRWAISGTPEYASPEQVRGDALDPRTDVYSLGATLYQLLSGRPPFAGREPEEIAHQVLHAPLPPLKAPGGLRAVVERAMQRDREARYAAAAPMAEDLRRFLAERPRPTLLRPAAWAAMVLAGLLSWGVTYAILARSSMVEHQLQILQLVAAGERALARAEQLRADRSASLEAIADAARQAIPNFSVAIRTAGGEDAQASLGLGRCYEILGLEDRAESAYGEARILDAARVRLAALFLRRHLEGRADRDWRAQARQELSKVRGGDSAAALSALAGERWEEVLSSGAAAVAREPYDDVLHLAMGQAALSLKRWDPALLHLEQAERLRRGDMLPVYLRGMALAGKGDRAGARAAFMRVISGAPASSPLRSAAHRMIR